MPAIAAVVHETFRRSPFSYASCQLHDSQRQLALAIGERAFHCQLLIASQLILSVPERLIGYRDWLTPGWLLRWLTA